MLGPQKGFVGSGWRFQSRGACTSLSGGSGGLLCSVWFIGHKQINTSLISACLHPSSLTLFVSLLLSYITLHAGFPDLLTLEFLALLTFIHDGPNEWH